MAFRNGHPIIIWIGYWSASLFKIVFTDMKARNTVGSPVFGMKAGISTIEAVTCD